MVREGTQDRYNSAKGQRTNSTNICISTIYLRHCARYHEFFFMNLFITSGIIVNNSRKT